MVLFSLRLHSVAWVQVRNSRNADLMMLRIFQGNVRGRVTHGREGTKELKTYARS